MKTTLLAGLLGVLCLLPTARSASREAARPEESVESIDADFSRAVQELERQRIQRLDQLAQGQPAQDAVTTYQALFQDALVAGLFRDAEPVAERVLQKGQAPPRLRYLAHLTNILAEVDRGEFEESLRSIEAAIDDSRRRDREADEPRMDSALPEATRLSLIETYYQRLVQAGQFDVARRAFGLIRDQVANPATREYAEGRLARLKMIGQPAPPIVGQDIDGKPFRLDDLKGQVVLVDFWATWCLPSAVEAVHLGEELDRYQKQGFRIVGVNLDPLDQHASKDPADHLPTVRRFLIEHNIRWPILLNGPDALNFAHAYGVTDIPANFLVGPEGKIIAVDLLGKSLDTAIQNALKSR